MGKLKPEPHRFYYSPQLLSPFPFFRTEIELLRPGPIWESCPLPLSFITCAWKLAGAWQFARDTFTRWTQVGCQPPRFLDSFFLSGRVLSDEITKLIAILRLLIILFWHCLPGDEKIAMTRKSIERYRGPSHLFGTYWRKNFIAMVFPEPGNLVSKKQKGPIPSNFFLALRCGEEKIVTSFCFSRKTRQLFRVYHSPAFCSVRFHTLTIHWTETIKATRGQFLDNFSFPEVRFVAEKKITGNESLSGFLRPLSQ